MPAGNPVFCFSFFLSIEKRKRIIGRKCVKKAENHSSSAQIEQARQAEAGPKIWSKCGIFYLFRRGVGWTLSGGKDIEYLMNGVIGVGVLF